MPVKTLVFETSAYTNSATPADLSQKMFLKINGNLLSVGIRSFSEKRGRNVYRHSSSLEFSAVGLRPSD